MSVEVRPSPFAIGETRFARRVGVPGLVVLVAVLIVPLLGLGLEAWRVPWAETFADPAIGRTLLFTYGQALVSAALATAIGLVAGVVVAERGGAVAQVFERVALATVALPAIVFTSALFLAFGRAGWLGAVLGTDGFFGLGPLLFAHVLFNAPMAVHWIASAVRRLDRLPERVALSLGATPRAVAWYVTLPRVLPEAGAVFLLAFLYCSTSFLIPLLVGASPLFATVEVAIYQLLSVEGRLGTAAQLGCLHALVCASALAWLPRSIVPPRTETTSPYMSRVRRPFGVAAWALGAAAVLTLGVPFAALLLAGVRGAAALASEDLGRAVAGSALAALVASTFGTALAASLAWLASRSGARARRALEALALSPLAFSPLLLFFAWQATFRLDADSDAFTTLVAVGGVQAVTALPLAFRYCLDAFRNTGGTALSVAATLGAGPLRRWVWLVLPQVAPVLASVAALLAAVSVGEVGAVLLAGNPDVATLPLAMYRAMGQYRFGSADALGALLLVITAALLTVGGLGWRSGGGGR